ncbi:hypothetical protein CC79DRAFT_1371232 [Sarocladium strictum]
MAPAPVPYTVCGYPYPWAFPPMVQGGAMGVQQKYWSEQQRPARTSHSQRQWGQKDDQKKYGSKGNSPDYHDNGSASRNAPKVEGKIKSPALGGKDWPKPAEVYAKHVVPNQVRIASEATNVSSKSESPASSKPIDDLKDRTPPPNAPKAPRALRKTQAKASVHMAVIPLRKSEAVDCGSWSQSKRWMSDATQERMAFRKMQLNLRHIRADKSPFVPQSPTALAALRLEQGKRRLAREVLKRKGIVAKQGSVKEVQLYEGKKFGDMLSPVLAFNHCFTEG